MADTQEQRLGLPYERLAELAVSPGDATHAEIVELVEEVQRRRDLARMDSRAAQQIKRLRWTAENLVSKVERMEQQNAAKEAETRG